MAQQLVPREGEQLHPFVATKGWNTAPVETDFFCFVHAGYFLSKTVVIVEERNRFHLDIPHSPGAYSLAVLAEKGVSSSCNRH
jgi:hypothetical protein